MPFFENASGTIANSSTFNEVAGNQINNSNSYPVNNIHSNNDSSVTQHVRGNDGSNIVGRAHNVGRNISNSADTFHGPVNHGDTFNGPIYRSNVGGRGNVNTIINRAHDNLAEQVHQAEEREAQLMAQLAQIRAQIEAKRAQQRVDKLAAQVAAAMSELAELNKRDGQDK